MYVLMKRTYLRLKKHLDLAINKILYKLKNSFFENDVSAFKWTSFVYITPIVIYLFLHKVCDIFNICWWSSDLKLKEFISILTTIIGAFLAFLVMLNINNKRTKTGSDFIQLISNELYSLSNGEEITIISPNMNIGSYLYKGESMFEVAIKRAAEKGVIIKFITYGLDINYLKECLKAKGADQIAFLKKALYNSSPQLTYIYDRYICKLEDEETNNTFKVFRRKKETAISVSSITIKELSDLVNTENIKILINCQPHVFDKIGLIGFFTKNKLFIGKSEDINSYKGKVNVIGETIELPEIIKVYSEYLTKQYKAIE